MRILVYGLGGGLVGGVKTFLFSMYDNMSNDLFFDYVIDDTKCDRLQDVVSRGGEVFFVSKRRHIFKNINDWKRLLRSWKKDGNDTVYFNLSTLNYCTPVYIALKLGYRVIIHAHNNAFHNCNFVYKILHYFNKQILKHKSIVRLSNSDLSSTFMFGKKESAIVYNAIDVNKFRFNENERNRIREKLHVDKSTTVYGFVGRIDYQKNPIFLARIFKSIIVKEPNSVLLVVGEGSLEKEMATFIHNNGLSNNVIFYGPTLEPESLYNVFDVFLLPSIFEGLGIVLIEAQANGLPCLTTLGSVPYQAKILDCFSFVSLEESPDKWANFAIELSRKKINRRAANLIVEKSRYNLKVEAQYLERILKNE